MKFLSKIGKIILKGTTLLLGIGRVTKDGRIVAIADTLLELQDIIIKVEAMGQALNLPGADKLRAAGPLFAQALLSSAVLVDRKIDKPELFELGASKMANGLADVLNSLKDDIETEDK